MFDRYIQTFRVLSVATNAWEYKKKEGKQKNEEEKNKKTNEK